MTTGGRLACAGDPVAEVWLSWPTTGAEAELERARELTGALFNLLTDFEASRHDGPRLRLLTCGEEAMRSAQVAFGALPVSFHHSALAGPFNGREPILFWHGPRKLSALVGQGLEADAGATFEKLGRRSGFRLQAAPLAFARGAIETDGEGTALLTRSHWLRQGWNPNLQVEQLEKLLAEEFGIERCLWIDRGIESDPAADLVTLVARFVAPGRVLCLDDADPRHPFAGTIRAVRTNLRNQRDARQRPLELISVPAPMPSHGGGERNRFSPLGFLRVDPLLLVPTFGDGDGGEDALRNAFGAAFPDHRVVLLRVPPPFLSLHALALTLPAHA